MSEIPKGFKLVLHPMGGIDVECNMEDEFLFWRKEWSETKKFSLRLQGPQFNVAGLYFMPLESQ